jgi:hypothetical protein
LISEKDYQNYKISLKPICGQQLQCEGIAENLAKYYLLYGDINLINTEIDLYHSIIEKKLGKWQKNI